MGRFPALLLLLLAVGGCRTVVVNGGDPGLVEAGEMGSRLGLRERRRTDDRVVLVNDENVVIVFSGAGGRIWVNERPVGPIGAVTKVGDRMLIPAEMVPAVKRSLRLPPKPPPKEPEPERPPEPEPPPKKDPPKPRPKIVVLDAGHGGRDPGAIGPAKTREKDVNLAVATATARRLRSMGFDVRLTRSTDRFLELPDRAEIGNRARAHLFVSIHSDAATVREAHGYTIFVRRGPSAADLSAARAIERAMRSTGHRNRGVRQANYRVLVESDGPAVLVETGFLSNPAEERRLADPAFREKIAAALAAGIRAGCGSGAGSSASRRSR